MGPLTRTNYHLPVVEELQSYSRNDTFPEGPFLHELAFYKGITPQQQYLPKPPALSTPHTDSSISQRI